MRKTKKKVRLYLTVDRDLHTQLVNNAKSDFMKVATWTTQFLMKSLSNNKPDCLTLKTDGTM